VVALLSSLYTDLVERGLATTNPAKALPRATRRLLRSSHDRGQPRSSRSWRTSSASTAPCPSPWPWPMPSAPWPGSGSGRHWRFGGPTSTSSTGAWWCRSRYRTAWCYGQGPRLPGGAHLGQSAAGPAGRPAGKWWRRPGRGAHAREGTEPPCGPHPGQGVQGALAKVNAQGTVIPAVTWYQATRHTYASQFVLAGGSIEKLREALGHSTVLVTERYAHLRGTSSPRPTWGAWRWTCRPRPARSCRWCPSSHRFGHDSGGVGMGGAVFPNGFNAGDGTRTHTPLA